MRRNPPTLVNPADVVQSATDRQLGITAQRTILQRLDALERGMAALTGAASNPLARIESTVSLLEYLIPGLVWGKAVKGTTTPTSVTSSTGTTITNTNIGPLVAGMPYLVLAIAVNASNSDPGGFIFASVRIESTGTSTDGMQTGTAAGERTLVAFDGKTVTGTGATINIAGRARNSAGGLTGSVNDATVLGVAIPTQFAVIP